MDVYHLQTQCEEALSASFFVLRQGGVLLVPTETVYGLVTRYDNLAGRERIFAMKQRLAEKQLQMLAADLAMAFQAGLDPDPRLERLAARFFPGPLTLVCKAGEGTIGLRIPEHPFVLELIRRVGFPLAATSANRSGEPAAATAPAALAGLLGEPDLLVDAGEVSGRSSTVVSLLRPRPEILRPGTIALEEVEAALLIQH